MNDISIEDKKKCVGMTINGLNSKEVYEQFYSHKYTTGYESFRHMLKRWKKKYEVDETILESGNLGYKFTPHATTVQVNANGEVIQAWVKSHASNNLYAELIENIRNLKPFEPIKRKSNKVTDRMLEIPHDDAHFGIAFYEDYEDTLNDTIEIIEEKPNKEINIVMGADLMHTNDMQGHTNKGTYIGEIDMVRAYNDALKFYFALIECALRNSERVRVIYTKGNHSECLSWTIVQVLKVKYPQCEFDDNLDEERKIILYEKVFIGVTHGEELPGNLKDIKNLFMEEHPLEYCNATVKEIHTSHLHTEKDTGDIGGCVVRRLSTRVPTDKYHKKHGYTCNNKRFMLFEYSKDRLKSIRYV